ncbi:hypothetical protein [Brevibacillus centrosporus]|uniref:Uncharacterized protein n=1 Tax=Brevibacillus centrosporus TaxID=54910 RepID=A0A1I3T1K3_9BACL|nr:hypothetical protein [Brevibacillus centrosporus]MEC2128238.1 hypothetical protein [Brevibacillus centrosporus]MED4909659.1 hypothetical protein [Brevibacillus centrosporus]SFJ64988.1 hypothetical protein SAMN05518846_104393 [Brevibacillus centrosporus]
MIHADSIFRRVCEECLSITTEKHCPVCGHGQTREIVINVQSGKRIRK